MNSANIQKAALKPIMESDIGDVALFLHRHMKKSFSKEEWEQGLRVKWYEGAPNHGFMLQTTQGIVGVICTLYSAQEINGETTLICNPHTWCVLEPYRGKSVSLVLSVIRQEGMHYTMFSPNREGEEIFSYLGFKPLEREMRVCVNIPAPFISRRIRITSGLPGALDRLTPRDRKCVTDHRDFKWLQFVFYESHGRSGFIIYKCDIFKRLPSARVLYISDKSLFADCWPALRNQLLFRHRILTTRIERRLVNRALPCSIRIAPASAKFYLSSGLPPEAFDYTYSELVAMDL